MSKYFTSSLVRIREDNRRDMAKENSNSNYFGINDYIKTTLEASPHADVDSPLRPGTYTSDKVRNLGFILLI